MQIPKCIKLNRPCEKHKNKQYLHHCCGILYCKKQRKLHDEKYKKRVSDTLKRKGIKPPSRKGMIPWNKGLKGYRSGEKSHLWKGGITPENHRIRTSLEIKIWKRVCFDRDNYTCQKTGLRGGKLVVHHINNFADYPELRTSISNGITLSKKSHIEFHHIYGNKNNTREQLIEFLNKKNG